MTKTFHPDMTPRSSGLALGAMLALAAVLPGCGGGRSASETTPTATADSAAATSDDRVTALRRRPCDRGDNGRRRAHDDNGCGSGGGGGTTPPANQPPVITPPGYTLSMTGANIAPLKIGVTDAEGTAMTLTCTGCPSLANALSPTPLTATYSLAAGATSYSIGGDAYIFVSGAPGLYDTRWTATDAAGASSSATFTWEVVEQIIAGALNGSFETAGSAADNAKHWVLQAGASVVSNGSSAAGTAPASTDGSRAALLRGTALLHQAMVVARNDQLEFVATQTDAGATQTLGVFVNGVQQGASLTPTRGAWSRHTVTLAPATSGPNVVEIRGLGSAGALVDSVRTVQAAASWSDTRTYDLEWPAIADASVVWDPDLYNGSLFIGMTAVAGSGVGLASIGSEATLGTPAPVDGKQVLVMRGSSARATIGNNPGYGSLPTGASIVFHATQGNQAVDQSLDVYAVSGSTSERVTTITPPRGSWQRYEIPLSVWVSYRFTLRSVELRGLRDGADVLIDSPRVKSLAVQ
jgi:hypothetical protein